MKKLLSLGFVSLVCAAQGRYRLTWKGGADGKERNKIVSVK